MSVSVYKLTIPSMLRGFGVLANYVEKAADYAKTNNVDPEMIVQARIARTVDFLKSVEEASFAGADTRSIEIKFRSLGGVFTGESYVTSILLPDFYFHVATAHGILRSRGVPIGKADYLGLGQRGH
jgi:hypothetical protein